VAAGYAGIRFTRASQISFTQVTIHTDGYGIYLDNTAASVFDAGQDYFQQIKIQLEANNAIGFKLQGLGRSVTRETIIDLLVFASPTSLTGTIGIDLNYTTSDTFSGCHISGTATGVGLYARNSSAYCQGIAFTNCRLDTISSTGVSVDNYVRAIQWSGGAILTSASATAVWLDRSSGSSNSYWSTRNKVFYARLGVYGDYNWSRRTDVYGCILDGGQPYGQGLIALPFSAVGGEYAISPTDYGSTATPVDSRKYYALIINYFINMTGGSGVNATITDIAGPYAVVQELPGVAWGKVLSPVLTGGRTPASGRGPAMSRTPGGDR
jgi:hypothetical protein